MKNKKHDEGKGTKEKDLLGPENEESDIKPELSSLQFSIETTFKNYL